MNDIMARHQIFRKIIKDGKEEMELILDEEQPDTIVDILVHSGDTINLQYSVIGGTIRVVRVVEVDAAVT